MTRDGLLRPLLAALASAGAVLLLAASPGPVGSPGPGNGGTAGLLVRAWPWARVRVDGGPWRLTPLAGPLPVSPGTHRVVAEHPVLGRVEREVSVAPGATLDLVLALPVRDAQDAGDPVPSTAPAGVGPRGRPGHDVPRSPRARDVPPPRGPGSSPGVPRPASLPVRQLVARRRAGRPAACALLARLLLRRRDLPAGARAAAVRHGAWAYLALGRNRDAVDLLAQETGRLPVFAPDPMIDPPALVALWPAAGSFDPVRP